MFEKFTQPVIIAHRGSSTRAPENTLSAFKLALEERADGIELDAKLTLDGQVVVIHDQTTDRTTGFKGTVSQMLLKELKDLEAGSLFDPKFLGEQIPTLDEVFEEVGGKMLINVELTNYASPRDALVAKVVDIVKRHEAQNSVLFSSFFASNLRRAAVLMPEVPRAILCSAGIFGVLARSNYGYRASPAIVHPYFTDVTPAYVNREHARNRRVHVWTVDAEADLRRMAAAGVDGIITDDPLFAREVVKQI
jgi:glycerophosphoryl diester phosphodiesterase